MEYRGVEIKLLETAGGGERFQFGDYKVGSRTKQVFGAGSKFGQAWASKPETALNDAKSLIDANLN